MMFMQNQRAVMAHLSMFGACAGIDGSRRQGGNDTWR